MEHFFLCVPHCLGHLPLLAPLRRDWPAHFCPHLTLASLCLSLLLHWVSSASVIYCFLPQKCEFCQRQLSLTLAAIFWPFSELLPHINSKEFLFSNNPAIQAQIITSNAINIIHWHLAFSSALFQIYLSKFLAMVATTCLMAGWWSCFWLEPSSLTILRLLLSCRSFHLKTSPSDIPLELRNLMTCGGAWRNPATVKRDIEECRHLMTFDLSYMVVAAFERDCPIDTVTADCVLFAGGYICT